MQTLKHEQVGPELLSELMKSLHEGVLILNDLNIIEEANESASTILKIEGPANLAGTHIGQLRTDNEALNELFASLADRRTAIDPRTGVIAENGYTHKGTYTIRTFREASNRTPLTLIVLHDIRSTNKGAEALVTHTTNLEKTNHELDQFAHIVSHDLKAPLRAISNLSLWLQEDLGPSLSGENRDNLIRLRGRVLRMESLINGILEYARVGREEIANETVDVFRLVNEAIELLSPPSHIKIEISENMPVLEAPKVMLSQVFSNLLSNAIKYNDKTQGVIKVYSGEKESCFEFTVEDNGPGIPAEYHEKIFKIFQTLHARDKFESTGIGLTIVKRILASKDGEIRVVSAPGEGSKFIFTWPK